MQINNVHIHLGKSGGFGAAMLGALIAASNGQVAGSREAPVKHAAPDPSANGSSMPKIGDAWPGVDGVYAGLSRGEEGEPDAHLVLLNAQPERDMNWNDAVAWAQGLGDGARLPTRFESALIYANLRDKVDTGRWHWTGTQYSADNAWSQGFDYGSQGNYGKSYEARCRAVRRFSA